MKKQFILFTAFLIFACAASPARNPAQIFQLGEQTCSGGPATCHASEDQSLITGDQAASIFQTLKNEKSVGPLFDAEGGESFFFTRTNGKATCVRSAYWENADDLSEAPATSYSCRGELP